MRRIKWFLLSTMMVPLMTSCNDNQRTLEEIAIAKVASYAQNGELAPILQDYIDAKTEGISADKLDVINAFILNLTYEDVDTAEEIQAIVDQFKLEIKESNPSPTPQPTIEPTPQPTVTPTPQPTVTPTPQPSVEPSSEPTPQPTVEPTPTATPTPTVAPTVTPTPQPSVEPTPSPTPNTTPVVDAGSDQSIELGQSATLSATASDSDGDTMSYKWSENGSVLATTLSFEYTPSSEGNYTLEFMATDEHNATATDSVTVEVTEECDPLSQFVGAC